MFQNMFHKHGRPPEQLRVGGYDDQSQEQQNQIPVHQYLVSLDGSRQLPLQPVREFERDVVMQDKDSAEQNLNVNVQVEMQHQAINEQPRQDNMLAFNPQQVMNPNRTIL